MYRDKLGEAKRLFDEALAIVSNPEATAEDKAKVQPMIDDAQKLKAEAGQLKDIADGASELKEFAQEKADEQQADDPPVGASAFKAWSDYLVAVGMAGLRDQNRRKLDPRLRYMKDEPLPGESKQMVESVGASGGFLVPTEFLASLQAVMAEAALVRSRATIIRMRRRQLELPVLDQTGTTAGLPHWFGGMRAYWAEEAAAKTLTEATFRKVSLVAHKLIMYTYASDELLDDSAISLADFLAGPVGFAGCIAWNEDYTFINGTGVGQPLGVIPAPATITVARAAGGAIGYADLANMVENFLPSGNGVWFITQSAMADLIQLAGPVGNASYIWVPNAAEGVPGYLLGMPVVWTEKCPLIGNAGDVILADWRYYLIGDRQATTVESTQYDRWEYDETSWRAVHRVDGQPWLSLPLTYQDGTTQVSPFVILGDKST